MRGMIVGEGACRTSDETMADAIASRLGTEGWSRRDEVARLIALVPEDGTPVDGLALGRVAAAIRFGEVDMDWVADAAIAWVHPGMNVVVFADAVAVFWKEGERNLAAIVARRRAGERVPTMEGLAARAGDGWLAEHDVDRRRAREDDRWMADDVEATIESILRLDAGGDGARAGSVRVTAPSGTGDRGAATARPYGRRPSTLAMAAIGCIVAGIRPTTTLRRVQGRSRMLESGWTLGPRSQVVAPAGRSTGGATLDACARIAEGRRTMAALVAAGAPADLIRDAAAAWGTT